MFWLSWHGQQNDSSYQSLIFSCSISLKINEIFFWTTSKIVWVRARESGKRVWDSTQHTDSMYVINKSICYAENVWHHQHNRHTNGYERYSRIHKRKYFYVLITVFVCMRLFQLKLSCLHRFSYDVSHIIFAMICLVFGSFHLSFFFTDWHTVAHAVTPQFDESSSLAPRK